MKPKITVISRQDEPLLQELLDELHQRGFHGIPVCEQRSELKNYLQSEYKGFFIFCLSPHAVKNWYRPITHDLINYFKIYYYHSLLAQEIKTSIFLYFDFLITGEAKNHTLSTQLNFLEQNYWKKIPLKLLGIRRSRVSRLLQNIIKIMEIADVEDITLDHVSRKLDLQPQIVRQEIKNRLNMNYLDLKNTILKYYHQNYPDESFYF
jgi:hypothetical protein